MTQDGLRPTANGNTQMTDLKHTTCPCGISPLDCDYHRPEPIERKDYTYEIKYEWKEPVTIGMQDYTLQDYWRGLEHRVICSHLLDPNEYIQCSNWPSLFCGRDVYLKLKIHAQLDPKAELNGLPLCKHTFDPCNLDESTGEFKWTK